MLYNNSITKVLASNLTDIQKEALLGEIANAIINEQQKDKTFEEKSKELIAKERQKTEALKKRLAEYEERSLKKENHRKRDAELEDKIRALSEITNRQGEKVYSSLSDLTGYEIERLYDMYFEKNKTIDDFDKENIEPKEKNQVTDDNVDKNSTKNGTKTNNEDELEGVFEDENEIIGERDGTEITKKEKFKKLAKKALKLGAVVGAIGLIGGAIYHFVNTGDSSQIEDSIKNVVDIVQHSASSVPNYDEITSVGNVTEVFSSNQDAIQNINSAPPIGEYFQNKILGYTTSDDQMTNASNLGEIINAHNNGKDITSIYVGNENGIDGFVNNVNEQSLTDLLEANKGGKSR